MNPEETNSNANMGATAAPGGVPGVGTSGSASIDFTTMGDSSNGLSMADSMASAEDNLTSAGMAAKDDGSNAIGLDQIGASDPSATMARPDEPLIPAAPVPGSIGSAISGPALTAMPDVTAQAANPAAAVAPMTMDGAATQVPQMPTVEQSAGMQQPVTLQQESPQTQTATPQSDMVQPIAQTAPTMPTAPVAQEPYNPFMSPSTSSSASGMAANGAAPSVPMTSSTSVPTALQPKTERFSSGKKHGSSMTMILGILTGLMTVLAAVFLTLWIITMHQLEEARNSKEIVYLPAPTDPEETDPVEAKINCWQDPAANNMEGIENLTSLRRDVTMNFMDKMLTNVSIVEKYTFTDHDAAEAARSVFDNAVASYTNFAIDAGITTLGMTYMVEDNVGTWNAYGNADQLQLNNVWAFGLPTNDDGNAVLSMDEITANYEGQGFVCEEVAE